MDIESISREYSPLIEKEIGIAFANDGIPNLHDAVWYHMGTGGKRIRPLLAIMACKSLGTDVNKSIPFAAACEVMHNWFLIHDDIEDGDTVRRGQETVWKKFGVAHGINVGDYMSQKVYEMILKSRDAGVDIETTFGLMKLAVDTASITAEGQAMDINLRSSDRITEAEYMKMITLKTAYYMTMPVIGGAMIAGADEKTIKKIVEFGMHLGPAFQITDDILDMTEGKGRNETGRDIKEGKRSILVVQCMSKCSPLEKARLLGILNKPPEETTHGEVEEVMKLFSKYKCIEYGQKKAGDLANKAKKTISSCKELKEVMELFADFITTRNK